ncbi:hypothetical protein LMG27174_06244 [Paraburkholderia rhynchosiae]|uniref:Uncharacterized protein n=1 Tax=Paraburkholderia rhynchosiae TaxID=487049 RepID=A0A6J5CFS3_9BURK|nr:hypothetical protein LMG27174_06244 [Paraburkholderia rhynchosiae]
MLRTLDFDLVEVNPGTAVFAGQPGERMHITGSERSTEAMRQPCWTPRAAVPFNPGLSAEQAYTTLELKVSYHKAITKDTGRLRATGNAVSVGRRDRKVGPRCGVWHATAPLDGDQAACSPL